VVKEDSVSHVSHANRVVKEDSVSHVSHASSLQLPRPQL